MNKSTTSLPNIDIYAIRLQPGQDLKKELQSFVDKNQLEAAWIATAVGSLTSYQIRFANESQPSGAQGHFEILNLSGTLSLNGLHIHISIADNTGKTFGGHLTDGCIIYTTAEIIIQSTNEYIFKREKDESTGWMELEVRNRP